MLESGRCADLVGRVEFKGCRRANFGEGKSNDPYFRSADQEIAGKPAYFL